MSRYRIITEGHRHAAEIAVKGNVFTCEIDGRAVCGTLLQADPPLYVVRLDDGRVVSCEVTTQGGQTSIQWQGQRWSATVAEVFGEMSLEDDDHGASASELRAPMPGRIVAIPLPIGAEVKRGDTVMVIEAMKMQNALSAPRAGTIQVIHVKPGDAVESGQVLAVISTGRLELPRE